MGVGAADQGLQDRPVAAVRHGVRRRSGRRARPPTTRRARSGSRSPGSATIASSASARRTTSGRWATPARWGRARRSTTSWTACRRAGRRRIRRRWPGWLEIWNLVFMQFERRDAGRRAVRAARAVDRHRRRARARDLRCCRAWRRTTTPICSRRSSREAAALAGTTLRRGPRGRHLAARDRRPRALHGVPDRRRRVPRQDRARVRAAPDLPARGAPRQAARHRASRSCTRSASRSIAEMGAHYPELRERAHDDRQRRARRGEAVPRARSIAASSCSRTSSRRCSKAGADRASPAARCSRCTTRSASPTISPRSSPASAASASTSTGFEDELDKARKRSRFAGSRSGGGRRRAQGARERGRRDQVHRLRRPRHDRRWRDQGDPGRRRARRARGGRRARSRWCSTRRRSTPSRGGQIGDTGAVDGRAARKVRIDDTKKPAGDVHVLIGEVASGTIAVGDAVRLRGRRRAPRADPRQPLGDPPAEPRAQAGARRSRRAEGLAGRARPAALRLRALLADDRRREARGRGSGQRRDPAQRRLAWSRCCRSTQAKQRGAVAMFGEKYGDQVRVVSIGGESIEFCGGTHVRRAGDIGLFKILSEAGVAQGVRRIEAVTGAGALDYLRKLEDELARDRRAPEGRAVRGRAARRQAARRSEGARSRARQAQAAARVGRRRARSDGRGRSTIKGIKVLAAAVEVDDAKVLRDTGDQLRDKLGSGVVVLAGTGGAEVKLVAMVTKDLVGKVSAGKLLGEIADAARRPRRRASRHGAGRRQGRHRRCRPRSPPRASGSKTTPEPSGEVSSADQPHWCTRNTTMAVMSTTNSATVCRMYV